MDGLATDGSVPALTMSFDDHLSSDAVSFHCTALATLHSGVTRVELNNALLFKGLTPHVVAPILRCLVDWCDHECGRSIALNLDTVSCAEWSFDAVRNMKHRDRLEIGRLDLCVSTPSLMARLGSDVRVRMLECNDEDPEAFVGIGPWNVDRLRLMRCVRFPSPKFYVSFPNLTECHLYFPKQKTTNDPVRTTFHDPSHACETVVELALGHEISHSHAWATRTSISRLVCSVDQLVELSRYNRTLSVTHFQVSENRWLKSNSHDIAASLAWAIDGGAREITFQSTFNTATLDALSMTSSPKIRCEHHDDVHDIYHFLKNVGSFGAVKSCDSVGSGPSDFISAREMWTRSRFYSHPWQGGSHVADYIRLIMGVNYSYTTTHTG